MQNLGVLGETRACRPALHWSTAPPCVSAARLWSCLCFCLNICQRTWAAVTRVCVISTSSGSDMCHTSKTKPHTSCQHLFVAVLCVHKHNGRKRREAQRLGFVQRSPTHICTLKHHKLFLFTQIKKCYMSSFPTHSEVLVKGVASFNKPSVTAVHRPQFVWFNIFHRMFL